jgi:hypothetical protein
MGVVKSCYKKRCSSIFDDWLGYLETRREKKKG